MTQQADTMTVSDMDGDMLRRFVRGDEQAFEQLVKRHQEMVLGVCRRVTENAEYSEDAAQATFLLLASRAKKLQTHLSVAGWLHRTAVNVSRTAQRSAGRRKQREALAMAEIEEHVVEGHRSHFREIVDSALVRLPAQDRECLVLHYVEGLSRAKLAARLDVKDSTLSMRLTRARERLRKQLRKLGLPLTMGAVLALLATPLNAGASPTFATAVAGAAGQLQASGLAGLTGASPQVVSLTQGVMKTMLIKKAVVATTTVCLIGAVCYLARPGKQNADRQETFMADASPTEAPAVPKKEETVARKTPAKASETVTTVQLQADAGPTSSHEADRAGDEPGDVRQPDADKAGAENLDNVQPAGGTAFVRSTVIHGGEEGVTQILTGVLQDPDMPGSLKVEGGVATTTMLITSLDADGNKIASNAQGGDAVPEGVEHVVGTAMETVQMQLGGAFVMQNGDIDVKVIKNGKLDADLVKSIQKSFEMQRKDYMAKWDKNGDGKIDEDEAKAIRLSKAEAEFEALDSNKNGQLSKEEFRAGNGNVMTMMPPLATTWTTQMAKRKDDGVGTIERFDENGDGVVDDAEKRKAAEGILGRMEQKGLSGEWKTFDTNGDGILEGAEREAILKDLTGRLGDKIGDGK